MTEPVSYRRLRDGSWEVVNDDGTKSIIWGIASTGMKAREGTAEIVHHKDGRQDAIVRPQPASLGIRSGGDTHPDFQREDLSVDLSEFQQALTEAMKRGEVKYTMIGEGKAKVDFESFQRWVGKLGQ